VFIPIEFCLAFTPAKSIYVFMSEKDGSNIQNVDSGDNGQNQKIIRIQMNLAGAFVDAKQYDLAIVPYTQIINDKPFLERLPNNEIKNRFLEFFLHEVEKRSSSGCQTIWSLDYVRLNIIADKS
jgi:hypothetical protein